MRQERGEVEADFKRTFQELGGSAEDAGNNFSVTIVSGGRNFQLPFRTAELVWLDRRAATFSSPLGEVLPKLSTSEGRQRYIHTPFFSHFIVAFVQRNPALVI